MVSDWQIVQPVNVQDALCGAGNGPGSENLSRGEREFGWRKIVAYFASNCVLRIFNNLHEDSTTYGNLQ